MLKKIPEKLQQEIDKYFNLQIAGKSVVCPYFINNKLTSGQLRALAGKGTPDEIELEVKIWAKVKGFDLANSSENEIRKFMMGRKIGIDCSGFITQVMTMYFNEIGRGSFVSKLKYKNNRLAYWLRRMLKPIQNTGADDLTSELNTQKIENLNEIEPGDLLRAKGAQRNAFHVGMVTEVEIGENGNIKRFKYVNSHRMYEDQNGMRYGEVFVNNPEGDLKDQNWTDELNGRNYFYEDLMVDYEDNGVRRLIFFEN